MSLPDLKPSESRLLTIATGFGSAAMILTIGMFAYLGTFTRYLADDYCDTVLTTGGSVLSSLFDRYMTVSDRFSNLLFAGLTEIILPHQIQIVPVVMIVLWTLALMWLVREVRWMTGFRGSWLSDIFLGTMLAFFPVFEAPNRFQTIYWRSAMATHFAPLVYLIAFSALLLLFIRRVGTRRPPIWLGALCLLIAFFGGGFSEPPDAMLIVACLIALATTWFWGQGRHRTPTLFLLSWVLSGAILALLVMGLSPANSFRLRTPPPDLPVLIYRTILSTVQFILDSLRTLPLPNIFSLGMPFLLFYGLYAVRSSSPSPNRRLLGILLLAVPFVMYVMIAASFAPSIYGQSYPVERARFAGRLMMTTAFIIEGVIAGVLFAQWSRIPGRSITVQLAFVFLVLSAFYPVRAGWTVLQKDIPDYGQWTSSWDARQDRIFEQKAQGKQDLVVPQLPGIEYIKELDSNPNFWVNRCAATFYGVNSISAVPFGKNWQNR